MAVTVTNGPKRVLLAAPRGYCAGVDRAVQTVEHALEQHGPPVYVRKEIVHNQFVVRTLRDAGAVFVDELDAVPDGATAVFSAHGVSPAVHADAARRSLQVIDATCPLVTKVHAEVLRFVREGYHILLIGHAGHEEVEGTTGHAPEDVTLIENVEQARTKPVPAADKLMALTQTTLSLDDTQAVIEQLRERFGRVDLPPKDDICYATQNRQNAVKAMCARGMDLLLVVGSRNSSNAARLVETATVRGVAGYLIDGPEELDPAWIDGVTRVGVTGGASTPDLIVQRVIERLRELGPAEVELCTTAEESTVFQIPEVLRGAS
jgi:4-hydroxy-3-methylbut-2-enyl diphosphate reductase